MKHVFAIKDFFATEESFQNIVESQLNVILKSIKDLDIEKIIVFVNDHEFKYGHKLSSIYPSIVSFVPTLEFKGNGKKSPVKQSFSAFHNYIVNSMSSWFSKTNTIIHIMDGTLLLTDSKSEFKHQETRLGEMIVDVCNMMDLLQHPVWFNTASDKGNLKFGHYFTKIDLINIDPRYKLESFPDCIMYSGNSNLDWIIIDAEKYKKANMPSLTMNKQYFYDFLSIKELIAKFANFEHGYFDCMFPTVPTEVGAYFRNPKLDRDLKKYDMSKYKENMKEYRNNLMQYKNLKKIGINEVLTYVKDVVFPELSDSDKNKLNQITEQFGE